MSPLDNNSLDYHHHHRVQDHFHPSFSSTLLDQIYNSIDDSPSDVSMSKKQNRVCVERILVNRRAVAGDSVGSRNLNTTVEPVFFKHSSSSSSSDSSGFSSSESDSFYRRTRSSRSPAAIHHPPKPIRTTVERLERPNNNKVKSKALKMYSDLKKVKQPISPGGRLATFLNSIFTGNTKKPNKINNTATSSSTTCSSASSFSRSCLSKTPSSSEKSKRSVRFCPVNVVHNSKSYGDKEREIQVMEENRRVIEAAKELIRTYQKNKDVVKISVEEEEEDEEDDDGASCASSDLFELDHLSVIGIDRYREELPVYETTRFNTSRVISR